MLSDGLLENAEKRAFGVAEEAALGFLVRQGRLGRLSFFRTPRQEKQTDRHPHYRNDNPDHWPRLIPFNPMGADFRSPFSPVSEEKRERKKRFTSQT
jgi:hypothetical protein